jgi:flagellar P-ring protein precursor FlgI
MRLSLAAAPALAAKHALALAVSLAVGLEALPARADGTPVDLPPSGMGGPDGLGGPDGTIDSIPEGAAIARIKDLVEFEGVRGNDLVGYGLVVGLDGTGDGIRNSPFTEEALQNLLERLGVNVTGEEFRPRNVAAVLVTATLPPFARAGGRIDVTVSTIGDAKSLLGGTLIMTPLNAADGEIYAVAQGAVISGGARAQGDAASVTQGVPTSGAIPGGARVEREVAFDFGQMTEVRLAVRDPDFTTAARIEAAVNEAFGGPVSRMSDAGTVDIDLTRLRGWTPAQAMARIENIEVSPSQKARVVVDHRSGTIVLGSDVRVSRIAVSQGNLTLRVMEQPIVSQPNPFSENGETVVVPRTEVEIEEEPGIGLAIVPEAVTLADVVSGLNALGVGPRDMIDILKAIKAAGALHAEFVVQ